VHQFGTEYARLTIKSADMSQAGTYYRVCVSGEGSTRCFNLIDPKKKTHNTRTVYFIITQSGVVQRCWCRCATTEGRKREACKDFKTATKPLLDAHKKVLFPLVTQKTKYEQIEMVLHHAFTPKKKYKVKQK
jgi:hypothetical protein